MTPEMMTYAIAGLAFIAITALGFAFAGGGNSASRGKQTKRVKTITESIPARASDCTAAPPIPPTPQTKTGAARRRACSASVTKPALRWVITA